MKLPFRFFLALIADYNRRAQAEQDAYEEMEKKSEREAR